MAGAQTDADTVVRAGPGARIEFADTLRGIAAICVLAHHLLYTFWRKPEIVANLIAYPAIVQPTDAAPRVQLPDFGLPDFWGHFGVALFFLISGFVIPFSVARLPATGFGIARILRIWPTYVIGLTVTLFCVAANAAASGLVFPYAINEVLSHYLILPRWPTLTRPVDGILWTLEIELAFYAFCLVVRRRIRQFENSIFLVGLISIPVAFAVGAGVNVLLAWSVPIYALAHWASSMAQFITYMLVGTAFYYFFKARIGLSALLVIQTGLLLAFVASWRLGVMSNQGWSGPICYLLAYAVFAAMYAGRNLFLTIPKPLRFVLACLAAISYPLYVVHGVLGYSILARASAAGVSPATALLFALAAVLLLATILHFLVEVPSQAAGKRLATRYG
jgi:peptidoglycan/LPS O-acetylase OafA/YrhL